MAHQLKGEVIPTSAGEFSAEIDDGM